MSPLTIQCVVEGHGEVEALPILLSRLINALCPGRRPDVQRPNRQPRSSILKRGGLEKWVEAAARDVAFKGGILVLLDADSDRPCQLAPVLLARARSASCGCPVSVILANCEYEAWIIASADALAGKSGFSRNLSAPANCEAIRNAKGWLQEARAGANQYAPTVDQAALTRLIDIDLARNNSPSFDKLCRDVGHLCHEVSARFGGA